MEFWRRYCVIRRPCVWCARASYKNARYTPRLFDAIGFAPFHQIGIRVILRYGLYVFSLRRPVSRHTLALTPDTRLPVSNKNRLLPHKIVAAVLPSIGLFIIYVRPREITYKSQSIKKGKLLLERKNRVNPFGGHEMEGGVKGAQRCLVHFNERKKKREKYRT